MFQPSGSPGSLYEYIYIVFLSSPHLPIPHPIHTNHVIPEIWPLKGGVCFMLKQHITLGMTDFIWGLLKDQREEKEKKIALLWAKAIQYSAQKWGQLLLSSFPQRDRLPPRSSCYTLCNSRCWAFVNLSWSPNSNLKQHCIMKRASHLKSEYVGKFDTFPVRL